MARKFTSALLLSVALGSVYATADDALPKALIDGTGEGWRAITREEFVNVNCRPDTWSWEGELIKCTGKPTGVMKLNQQYTNFELVAQWRHLEKGGNSGIFVWAKPESVDGLKPGQLPQGIEVQVLDLGYTEVFEKQFPNRKSDWFTCHGDVFPTGASRMKPFPPVAPQGNRSFPRKNLTRDRGEWNHYYIRAINGEVRLWVNGEEVSGGTNCEPRVGYICLESEGAPVEFRGLRIRVLP